MRQTDAVYILHNNEMSLPTNYWGGKAISIILIKDTPLCLNSKGKTKFWIKVTVKIQQHIMISILLWQYFSIIRPSPGQHSEIRCTISGYHVLWDLMLLTRCTQK